MPDQRDPLEDLQLELDAIQRRLHDIDAALQTTRTRRDGDANRD